MINGALIRRLLLPSAVLIIIGVAVVVGMRGGLAGWGTGSIGGAQAISFGEPQSGEIGLPNESDQWTFDGVAGQDVVIQLQHAANSSLDTVVELLAPGPDGRRVALNDDFVGEPSGDQWVRRGCCNSRIEYQLGETGTYIILAQGYGGYSTGGYELSLTAGIAAAPAADAAPAAPTAAAPAAAADAPGPASTASGEIAFGETESGVITSGGSDGWTFEGTAGQVVSINLYAVGAYRGPSGHGLDTYLILNKPSGAEEAADDDGGLGVNSRIQRPLDETGTYTIVARGWDGRPGVSTGGYELSLAAVIAADPGADPDAAQEADPGADPDAAQEADPGADPDAAQAAAPAAAPTSSCTAGSSYVARYGVPISRPIRVGEARAGEVVLDQSRAHRTYGSGMDWWTFEGTEGQNVLIQVQQIHTFWNTVLDLMDPNGRMECTNDDFGDSSNSRIETLLAETGTYTIVVRGYNWTSGAYLLSLSPSADQALDISSINLGGLPEAPSNVTGVPGDGQTTISWDAPLSDGGSPITGYVLSGSGMVQHRSEPISEIQVAADVSSRTFTGLLSGYSYGFRINAVNDNGPSQPAYFELLVGGPPPEQEITEVVHETDGGVTVQWAHDRGPGPWDGDWETERVTGPELWTSGYTWVVTAEPGGIESPPLSTETSRMGLRFGQYREGPDQALPGDYFYRFSPADFNPGTAYTFTVVATNVIGTGPRSDRSASVRPGVPPGPPTLVELRPGDSEITLSWTSPSVYASNTPVTGYKVSTFDGRYINADYSPLLSEDVLAADVRTHTVTGLQNESEYTFTVETLSAFGPSGLLESWGGRPSIFWRHAGSVSWDGTSCDQAAEKRGADYSYNYSIIGLVSASWHPNADAAACVVPHFDLVLDPRYDQLHPIKGRLDVGEGIVTDHHYYTELDEWTFDGEAGQWVSIVVENTRKTDVTGALINPDAGYRFTNHLNLELVAPNPPRAVAGSGPSTTVVTTVNVEDDISCYGGFCSAGEIFVGQTRGNDLKNTAGHAESDHWLFQGTVGQVIRVTVEIMPDTEVMPLLLRVTAPSDEPRDCWPYTDPGCPGQNWEGPVLAEQRSNLIVKRQQVIKSLIIAESGPHIIEVKGLNWSTPVYKLRVEELSPAPAVSEAPDAPPQDLVGEVINVGETKHARISTRGETDSYLFYGVRGEAVIISMTAEETYFNVARNQIETANPEDCHRTVPCIDSYLELIAPSGLLESYGGFYPSMGVPELHLPAGSSTISHYLGSDETPLVLYSPREGGWVLEETGWYQILASSPGRRLDSQPRLSYDTIHYGYEALDNSHLILDTGNYKLSLTKTSPVVPWDYGSVETIPMIGLCPARLPVYSSIEEPHPNCVALQPYRPQIYFGWPSKLEIRRQLSQTGTYTIRARGLGRCDFPSKSLRFLAQLPECVDDWNGSYSLSLHISDQELPGVAHHYNSPPLPLFSVPVPIDIGETKVLDFSGTVVPATDYLYRFPIGCSADGFVGWHAADQRADHHGRCWTYWDYGYQVAQGQDGTPQPHAVGGYLSFAGTAGQIVTIEATEPGISLDLWNPSLDGDHLSRTSFGIELISPTGKSQAISRQARYVTERPTHVAIYDHTLRETGTYRIKVIDSRMDSFDWCPRSAGCVPVPLNFSITLSASSAATAVNNAPVAADDVGSVLNGGAVAIDVVANDTDADGDPVTIDSYTQGANGTVAITHGGLTYTHDGSDTTSDTFTYTVSDGNGGADTGTVTITITINNAPVAVDDVGSVAGGGAVEIDVVANDTDADGDSLYIGSVTQGANGTVEMTQGGVIYTHDGSATTSDSFTYTVGDGNGGTATGTVTVTIAAAVN